MKRTVEEKREANRLRVNRWRAANREKVRSASREKWKNDLEYQERQRARRRTEGYREKEYQYQRDRRKSPDTWASTVLRDIRRRSKKADRPFNLVVGDIVLPPVCPIFGTEFVFGQVGHPCSPSVDRLIPELGYVRGNIAVLSRRANMLKCDCYDPEVFRRLAAWIEQALAL